MVAGLLDPCSKNNWTLIGPIWVPLNVHGPAGRVNGSEARDCQIQVTIRGQSDWRRQRVANVKLYSTYAHT